MNRRDFSGAQAPWLWRQWPHRSQSQAIRFVNCAHTVINCKCDGDSHYYDKV